MRLLVATISLAILFAACVHAGDVQPQKDFDLQRFSGKWYRVGLAYDSPNFVPYRNRLKINVGVLKPLENGNANMSMWSQRSPPGQCRSDVFIYEKTAVPGQFTYFSNRHKRVKDITVVETNYSEYALVLKHKKMNREFTQVALYGRSPGLKQHRLDRFIEFSLSRGFPKDSILTPQEVDGCPLPGK